MANDPFQRQDSPTEEHRCYLWMQRDRIDLDHQRNYCLSSLYRDCPWVQISLPCRPGDERAWKDGLACTMADNGRRAGTALAAFLMMLAARAGLLLGCFAIWARTNLPRAMAWLWKNLWLAARTAAAGVVAGSRNLAGARLRPPRQERVPKTQIAVLESENFSLLMRLGREANRAGRRKEAHLCFSRAAALEPDLEEAWLWMAATASDPDDAQACLEKALAINPASSKVRTQLLGLSHTTKPDVSKQEEAVPAGISAPRLIDEGLKALDAGNEDRAHHLFAAATEADTSSEAAWFWRAKTGTDLDDVISSLERVLELNPDNQKAQASLKWATDRRRMERDRQRMVSPSPASRYSPSYYYAKPEPPPQPFLLQFGSLAYLVLGILWTAAVVSPLLDETLAALYRKVTILPSLRLPYQSPSVLDLPHGSVPEFNLFYLAPVSLALLSFIAMETLGGARRNAFFYLSLASGGSTVAAALFVTAQPASLVILASSTIAAVCALAGRVQYSRRLRAQTAPTSEHTTVTPPSPAAAGRAWTARP